MSKKSLGVVRPGSVLRGVFVGGGNLVDAVVAAQLAGILSRLADGALGEAGRQLWDGLARLVSRARKPETQVAEVLPRKALAELEAHPDDAESAAAAVHALKRLAVADPDFAALLRQWWTDAERLMSDADVRGENVIHGDVSGPVVQARDIHGAISFGEQRPAGGSR
jgi:hypothetical protein